MSPGRPEQLQILRPWAATYAAFLGAPRKLYDDELFVLRDACRFPTPTNCWWAEYDVARLLAPEIDRELENRAALSVAMFLSKAGHAIREGAA